MYKSLQKWLKVPVQIYKFVTRDGDGIKQTGQILSVECSPISEYKVVKNAEGKEIVSKHQLYFNGDVNVGAKDTIVFEEAMHSIQSISTFYDKGVPVLKVVYL